MGFCTLGIVRLVKYIVDTELLKVGHEDALGKEWLQSLICVA